jgi:hypothetical protein
MNINRTAARIVVVAVALAGAPAGAAESPYATAARPDAFVTDGTGETTVDPCPIADEPYSPWLSAAPAAAFEDPCAEPDAEVPTFKNADLERFAVPEVPRAVREPRRSSGGDRATWDYVGAVLDQAYERLDADREYRLDEAYFRESYEEPEPDPWRGHLALAPWFWGPCYGCGYHPRPRLQPQPSPPPLRGEDAVPVRITPPHNPVPIGGPAPATGVTGGGGSAPSRRPAARPQRGYGRERPAVQPGRSDTGGRSRASGADAVPRRYTPPPKRAPALKPKPAKAKAGGR